MKNTNNCGKKLKDNMWDIMAIIIKLVICIISYLCRNDPKKMAVIILIDTLLAIVLRVLTILFKDGSCCKKKSDEEDEATIIAKGKEFYNSIFEYLKLLVKLKKIGENNEEVTQLLSKTKEAVNNLLEKY